MTVPAGAIRLQPLTRARVASLGDVGADWVADLPRLLAEVADRWGLTLGRPRTGGSSSYVVGVETADGTAAVLKLALPDPGLAAQVRTLERAAGRGYARLLAFDADPRALLLEALGPSLQQSTRPPAEQLRLLADTLALAWQPAADHPDGPTDKAGSLHDLVETQWQAQGRPCSERVVAQALAYARRRATVDAGERVVVHGDPHPGNLLAAPGRPAGDGTGWCFVDPDGFVTDRAYDLGVVLRDWSSHLVGPGARVRLEAWCTLLAEHTGVDATRIWEWAFLERVSTGLHVRSFGAERAAAPFLRTAELLLD